jgi:C-type mannose receptor
VSFSVFRSQECLEGWKEFGNSCYLFVLPTLQIRGMSWEDARDNCLRNGSDLVSIQTSSERDFIFKQIRAKNVTKDGFWIGLFRNRTTGDHKEGWVWSDGNIFKNPGQWAVGQPENYPHNENCARIYSYDKGFGWHDRSCALLSSSVCKKKKGALISKVRVMFRL